MQELSTLAKQLQSSKLKLTALKVQVLKDITKITDFKKLNLKLITLQNHIDQLKNQIEIHQVYDRPKLKQKILDGSKNGEISEMQRQIFESIMLQNVQAIENMEIESKYQQQTIKMQLMNDQIILL